MTFNNNKARIKEKVAKENQTVTIQFYISVYSAGN